MKKVFTKRALAVLFVLMTFGMMALKANPTEGNNIVLKSNVENLMSPVSVPAPLPEGVNLVITTTEPLESGVASFDTVYYGTVSMQEVTYTLGFSGAITEADRNKIYTFAELSMLMSESWSGFDYFINNFKDVFYQSTSLESNPYYSMYTQLFSMAWASSNAEGMLFGTSGVYNADTLKYYYVTGADIEAGLDFTFRYTPSNKNYSLDEASFTIVSPDVAGPVVILAYEPNPLKKQVYYYFMGTNGYPEYPTIGDASVSMKGWGKEPFITIECADLEGTMLSFDSVYFGHERVIPATLIAEGLGTRNVISFAELYLLINNSSLISPNANNPFNLTDLVQKFHQATQTDLTTAYDQLFSDVLTRNIQQLIPGATVDELRYYYLTKTELENGVDFNFIYTPPSIDADNAATLQITSADPQTTSIINSYQSTYPEAYALYNNYPQLLSSVGVGVEDIVINAVGYGKPGRLFIETTPVPLTAEGYYVCDSTYFGYVSDSVEYTIKGIGLEPGKIFSYAEMIALWADNSTYNNIKNTFPSDYINKFDKTGFASPFDLLGDDSVYNVYFQRAFTQAAKLIWGSTSGHVYQDLQYYWINSAELEAGISFKVAYTPSAAYQVSSYSPSVVKEPVVDSACMLFVDKAYDASLISSLLNPLASAYDTAIYDLYRNYPVFDEVRVATIGNPLRSFISVKTDITLDADGYHTFEGVSYGCTSDSVTYTIYGEGIQPDRTFTYVELAVLMADSSTAILTGNPFPSDYVDKFRKATPIAVSTDMHDMFEAMWEGYPTVVTNLLGASYYDSHDKTYADTLAYYYVTGAQLLDSIDIKIAFTPSTPNLTDSARMWLLSTDVSTAVKALMLMPEPKRTFYRSLYGNYPDMDGFFIGTKGTATPSVLALTPHDINEDGYQYYDFGDIYYGYSATPTRNYQIKTSSLSATCMEHQFSYVELLLLMDSLSWENYVTGDPFPWMNLVPTFNKPTQISNWKPGYDVLFDNETLLREAGKRLFGTVYTDAATKAELADTLKYYYVTSVELGAGINIEIGYTPLSTVSVDSARMVLMDPRDMSTYPIFVANPTVKAIYDDYPLIDSVVIAVRGEGKPPVISVNPVYPDTTHFGTHCVGTVTAPTAYSVNGIGFIPAEGYTYAEWLPLMEDSSHVYLDGVEIFAGDPFPSNYTQYFRYFNGDPLMPKPELPKYNDNQVFYDNLFAAVWNTAAPKLGLDLAGNSDTLRFWYVSGAELNAGITFDILFAPEGAGDYYAQMGMINPLDASMIKALPDGDPTKVFYTTNYPVFDNVIIQVDGDAKDVVIADLTGNTPICDNGTLTMEVTVDPLLTEGDLTYAWSSIDYPNAFSSIDTNVFVLDLANVPVDAEYHFKATVTSEYGCVEDSTIAIKIDQTFLDDTNHAVCYYALPYTWQGQTFAQADFENIDQTVVVWDSLQRFESGCDSVYRLELTINREYDVNHPILDKQTICAADTATFTWEGHGPYHGLTIGTSFYDTAYLLTAAGCDSVRVLELKLFGEVELTEIIGPSHVYSGQTLDYAVIYNTDAAFYAWSFEPANSGFMFISNDTTEVPTLRVYASDLVTSCQLKVKAYTPGCGEDSLYYDITVLNEGDASITIIPADCSVCESYDFGNVYVQHTAGPATFTVKGTNLENERIITYAELLPLMADNTSDLLNEPFPSNYIEKFEKATPAWAVIPANYDALFQGVWHTAGPKLFGPNYDIEHTYVELASYYVTGSELNSGIPVNIYYHPSSADTCEMGIMEIENPLDASLIFAFQENNPLVYSIYNDYPVIYNAEIAVKGCGSDLQPIITMTPNDVAETYNFGDVYFGQTSTPRVYTIYGQNLDINKNYSYAELSVLMADNSIIPAGEPFPSNYIEQFYHYQQMPINDDYVALFNEPAIWDNAVSSLGLEAGDDHMILAHYYVTAEELMQGIDVAIAYRPQIQAPHHDYARMEMENPADASGAVTLLETIYRNYPVINDVVIDVQGDSKKSFISVTPNDVLEPFDFGGTYLGQISDVRNYTIYGEGLDPMRYFSYAELAVLMADNSFGDDEIFLNNYVEQFYHHQPMPIEGIYVDLFNGAFADASQRLPITTPADLANYYVTGAELMQGIDIYISYKPAQVGAYDQARVKLVNPADATIVISQPDLLNELFFNYPEFVDFDINVVGHTNQPVITVTPQQVFDFGTVCYESVSESTTFTFSGTGLDLTKSYSFAEFAVLMDRNMNYTEGDPFPSNYVEAFYHAIPMATNAEYDALFAATFNDLKPLMDLPGDDPAILAHYYVTAAQLLEGVEVEIAYTPTDKFSFDTASMEITNNIAPFIPTYPTIYANYPMFDQCIIEVYGQGTSPEVQFYGNTVICEGESVNITAVDLFDNTFDWYRWAHSLENTSVITVSPTETTTYYVEVMNLDGCFGIDSVTVYVNPTYYIEEAVTVCENDLPYIWAVDGQTYTEGGIFEYNPGTAIYGCDSIYVLNLTVNPSYNYNETVVVCSNELPYEWDGLSLMTTGLYTAPFTTINGCDSIYNIDFTVNVAYDIQIAANICDGDNYLENGFNLIYPRSGVYTQNLQTVDGCDSIITLTLTVNPNYVIYTTENVCDSYTWNGITYTTDGVYTQNFVSAAGCDSMVILVLHINHSYMNDIYVDICEGESYEFCGQTLTTNAIVPCYGTTVSGCDSIVTLHLTVHPLLPAEMLIPELCEGSIYQDNDFIVVASMDNVNVAPNIISDTAYLTTMFGCDSVRILNLTVLQPPAINYLPDVNICMGDLYEFYGQQITTTGIYTAVLTANNGCDSLIQVNVTVYPIPIIIIDGNTTICSGESTTLTARPFTGPNSNYEYLWVRVNIGAPNDTIAFDEPTINTGALINDGSLPGSYIYIASIRHTLTGCTRETNVTVTVNPLPINAQINGPSFACEGEEITLTASGAQSYIWNNGQTGEVITLTATDNTTIGMRATNIYGCSTPSGTWIEHAITVNAAPAPILSGVGEAYVISLSWTDTDAEEYWIYRDNNLMAITESTSYIDEQLIQGLPYCYTVVAYYGACLSVPSNEICTRTTSVEISEEESSNDIQLYPNPANNVVNIKGDNMKVLNVYNTLGQKVATINVADQVTANFDVTTYESGMYIIRIETQDGSIVTKRMIVVH